VPTKVAVDVHYEGEFAYAGAVLFDAWTDAEPVAVQELRRTVPAEYRPGHFFERELPCILPLIVACMAAHPIETIVVDGYVDLGPSHPGLGRVLFEALERKVAVIGVAKTAFFGAPSREVLRGESKKPLLVTSTGDLDEAARAIETMAGPYRVPYLLRRVDQLVRKAAEPAA
jgi:deoxyribonuclease V